MAFHKNIVIQPEDIDQMGHVNNVVYLRYVQEVAEAHWNSIANIDLKKEVLWVVLRHEIDYKRPAFNGDKLKATTWVDDASGVKFPRYVTIENEKGKVVISAKTTWCCIDGKTKKPRRITPELYQLFV